MATRVASIVAEVGIDGKKFDAGINNIINKLGIVNKDFAKFGIAAGLAFGALTVANQQMRKAIDTTVSYADEVRRLSSVTNQSAEETSRLIQMMDDYKLSAEQAGQAARFMAKSGLSLNVDTLAQLSDEYKKLNTGQERATFLMKNFGKAGQDFTTIMEAGGEAIKKNAEATNQNLILTQKMLTATRDYEIAQDELNDTMEGFYIVAGVKIVPALNQMVQGLINAGDFSRALRIQIEKIDRAPIDSATRSYMAMAESIKNVAEDTDDVLMGLSDAEESFLLSTREMTPQVVAEFVTLETKIAQVKRMIASGASFNVIVNFLAGKTIMVDQNSISPSGPMGGGGSGQWVRAGKGWEVNTATGRYRSAPNQKAKGGKLTGGWTMVGEQGAELIDPSGYVHSNQESKRLVAMGITPFRKLATGGKTNTASYVPPPPNSTVYAGGPIPIGYPSFSEVTNPNSKYNVLYGGADVKKSSGGGGGGGQAAAAVINTAAAASQSASSAAQQTSRAVDVTAQMSQQAALSSAQQAASLASIDRRLANMPNQIRDAFQQVIQQ